MEKLLTPEEVAEILAISEFTVKDYLRAGKITGVKIGKKWRVSPSALQEFIEVNTHKKTSGEKPKSKVFSREGIVMSALEPLTVEKIMKIEEELPYNKSIEKLKKHLNENSTNKP